MADNSTTEKVYIPSPPPHSTAKPPQPEVSEADQEKWRKVVDHFTKEDYKLPGFDDPLTEEEKFWLSSECIFRYLRASKGSLEKCTQRLEATLKWRREFGLYSVVTSAHVEPEAVTGKEILFGYDTSGRPAFYMIPSRQNTDEATRQVQFAVWMLERAIDLMDAGVENLDLLINYADKGKNPSMSTARTVLNILQDHYPERLGLAIILNVPFLLNAFFKIITPFIDPVTRNKMKFNPNVIEDGIFTPDMVMKQWWGGSADFEYKHEEYWPALVSICEVRKNAWMARWRELGGTIGLKEHDYKSSGTKEDPADEGRNVCAPTSIPEAE